MKHLFIKILKLEPLWIESLPFCNILLYIVLLWNWKHCSI